MYREKEGLTVKAKVTEHDEWLCEAYMKTDFSKLSASDFEKSILEYLSYEVKTHPHRVFSQSNAKVFYKKLYAQFQVGDLFNIYNGKEIFDYPRNIEAIQSGADNNAVLGLLDEQYCLQSGYKMINEPCLSVARLGTSGYVAYHESPCVIGDSTKVLILKEKQKASIYIYIYLRTVLMANKYKYAYGRKVTEKKYSHDIIVLPVTCDGLPDYMEDYIKQLPYGCRL